MSKRRRQRDWRCTLFYWRGELKLDNEKAQIVWKGSWAGTESSEMPSDDTFSDSINNFECHLEMNGEEIEPLSVTLLGLAQRQGDFKGTYLLDQGDGEGLQSFQDHIHRFLIGTQIDDSKTRVVACGSTEFGSFISAGHIIFQDEKPILTLARRYLDDKDPRCAWKDDPALVLKHTGVAASSSLYEVLPWRLDNKTRRL